MSRKNWWIAATVSALAAAALVLAGLEEQWDTATAVGVAGLAVAVGGFTIAILEVQRSVSVARATKETVDETLKGVAALQLIRLIEHLRQAVGELEDAVAENNEGDVRRAIRAWRTNAVDAQGHLERRFGKEHPALEVLDRSIDTARRTSNRLRKGDASAYEATPKCLEDMEKALDQLGPLRERLLPTMDELDEPT